MYQTNMYEGMLAETITMNGHNGDAINAYFARPLGSGPFPAWYSSITCPAGTNGTGRPRGGSRTTASRQSHPISTTAKGHGDPEDVGARVWADGGVPDDQAVGDIVGAMRYVRALPYHNRKVGVFGTCSGGRHVMLTVGRESGFDAGVDCWGGGVVMSKDQLNDKNPVAPIDYTANVSCPILGLFGLDDQSPTPEQVDIHEAELKKHGKDYEFHRYPNAGHGFFYYHRPAYRVEHAVDGWARIWDFFERHLS